MAFQFYKIAHVVGIMLLFMGLAGVMVLTMAGAQSSKPARRLAFITHGIGMVAMIVTGFGMLARLGYGMNLPGWAWAKLAIWFALGLAVSLARRRGQWGWWLIALFAALGGTAAYMALFKPF